MITKSLRASIALGILMSFRAAVADGDRTPPSSPQATADPTPSSLATQPKSTAERMGIATHRTGDPLVDQMLMSNMPLTTDQQLKVRQYMESDVKGLQRRLPPGNVYGDPVYVIDLTQGGPTQEVPLQLGYITNLMVVGENGAPWPIRRATTGDQHIVMPEIVEGNSTSLELNPQTPWVTTNLHVYLAGRNDSIKLYTRVSADPADGLRDSIKIVVDGVPPGSAPLLQPNRVAVDSQLMNALGQSPGRNWVELRVADADRYPFRLSYWMAPGGKDAIVRLRNAQMVGPDWAAETRDPDGATRVYRYEKPVPLMLRIRDAAGLEHQVRLDNPADLLAGRNSSRTMSIKQTSPARPPIDTALEFETPSGLVKHDRTQAIYRSSGPTDEISPRYATFEGKGKRVNRVEIVNDLNMNKDTARRMIEEAYRKRPAPLKSQLQSSAPKAAQTVSASQDQGSGALASPAPLEKSLKVSAAPATPPIKASVSTTAASVTPLAVAVAQPAATAPVAQRGSASSNYTMQVTKGGLYENLYAYAQKHQWKTPLWDLGNEDIVIEYGYSVTGSSPEEVIAKFLEPYSEAYKFNAQVSRSERAVWIH